MLIGVILPPGRRKPLAYTTTWEEEKGRVENARRRRELDPRVQEGTVRRIYQLPNSLSAYSAQREAIRAFRAETKGLRNPPGKPRSSK